MDPLCLVCSSVMETDSHIFLSCPFAKSCWRLIDLHSFADSNSSVFEWFYVLVQRVQLDKVLVASMVLWGLWRHRNEVCWQNKCQTAAHLLNLVSSFLFQWQIAKHVKSGDQMPDTDEGIIHWKKPCSGWLKCNQSLLI